ncbi:DUF2630 family protein [Aquabacterium fontiphilum]|uniref:DUF2630 family protein n=1 Tax=Aquabacterium fontiphilum TaxID=450365 RepID=UPI0013770FBA|nr:DUF2630 family protein [Aquabacterium fontiphilum]NBD19426.1 DUF2630 family protein [Aquabacterium fontiphilum]
MNDNELVERITALVDEEHRLRENTDEAGAHVEQLRMIEAQLDQCWDLLRQRRARREAGLDPDDARPRDLGTVTHYLN